MIAKSEAIAEEGCRRLKVDYEILPHVVDSAAAIAPGAPLIHPDKMPEHRVVNSARNIVAESHGEYGDVAAALSASAITWEGTFTTQRVQHAALETHGGFAFIDGEGVLTVRSSTQVPFLTRRTLADLFDLRPEKVRVLCERVGGGFGGKQEMFVEDILALAALKTGRPVKLELTREEQFISTSTRHPMRVTVKAGANGHGKLTALQLDVLTDTGAYGNHAGPVMRRAVGQCIGVHNRPNKQVDAVATYTNTVPAGAFRGYGLPQTLVAVEGAIDELAKQLGISPFEMRRRNIVKPGDAMLSPPDNGYHDVFYGSYGLDQCLDLVERAMAAETKVDLPPDWLVGEGIALTMIDTVPPAGHIGDCYIALREDGGFTLTVGTAEFGNGTSTVHRQIAATALATTVDQIELKQSDTAHGGHDTGAYILGVMHFEKVVAAPRGDIVIPFRLGVPQFHLVPILTMCIVMIVVIIESLGIGGIFNTFPYTSFSQNVGLVGITGVRSRWVTITGGAIMLLLGLIPKLAALVDAVPLVVLGGAGLVMFGMLAATGARILTAVDFKNNRYNSVRGRDLRRLRHDPARRSRLLPQPAA